MRFRLLASLVFFFLTFFAGFFFPGNAFADTFTLSGSVTDQVGQAIGNTTVSAVNSVSGATAGTVTTDATTGSYSLMIPDGTYNITATPPSSSGFQSTTRSNQVISGNTVLN